MLTRNMGVALAGGLGLAFVGYCVYFDHKRRSHPDFKKNLVEKRRKQQRERDEQSTVKYPDLSDEQAVQKFFLTEISLGEQLMALGDIENAVEHLANAVAVTAHKENLLNVLRTSLPDPIFRLLVERLPEVTKKIYTSYKQKHTGSPQMKLQTSDNSSKPTEAIITEIPTDSLAVDDLLD